MGGGHSYHDHSRSGEQGWKPKPPAWDPKPPAWDPKPPAWERSSSRETRWEHKEPPRPNW